MAKEEINSLQNKKDILGQIDQDNKNIFNNICETAEKLEISIDKINIELASYKHNNIINNKEFNKQKILTEMTKTLNRINYITVELNFTKKLIKSLKLSNCENLKRIEQKYKYASDLAPEIIEIIQNEFKKKHINLFISILS